MQSRASDPLSTVVSSYLENCTVQQTNIVTTSPFIRTYCLPYLLFGCYILTGQPQIILGLSGQPGLGPFLVLVLPAIQEPVSLFKTVEKELLGILVAAVTGLSALSPA